MLKIKSREIFEKAVTKLTLTKFFLVEKKKLFHILAMKTKIFFTEFQRICLNIRFPIKNQNIITISFLTLHQCLSWKTASSESRTFELHVTSPTLWATLFPRFFTPKTIPKINPRIFEKTHSKNLKRNFFRKSTLGQSPPPLSAPWP